MSDVLSEYQKKIELAKTNGQDAVAELLEIYRPWLTKLAENKIDSWLRPRLAASDVVQASILQAIDAFSQFRGNTEAELLGWLKRIFANHMIDRQRELLSQKRDCAREVPIEGNQLADSLTPSQIISAQEEAGRVVEAIGNLDDDLRAVVQLRYLCDLSIEDIAKELNLTRHAVSRRLGKAIEILAQNLRPREPPLQND